MGFEDAEKTKQTHIKFTLNFVLVGLIEEVNDEKNQFTFVSWFVQ